MVGWCTGVCFTVLLIEVATTLVVAAGTQPARSHIRLDQVTTEGLSPVQRPSANGYRVQVKISSQVPKSSVNAKGYRIVAGQTMDNPRATSAEVKADSWYLYDYAETRKASE